VACLVRQSLSGQAPLYLADDCRLVSDSTRRSLRSADVSTCVVPRTFSSYGHRTFAAAGPRLWNSLPVQLRNPDITYGLFRRQLEGHLFSGSRTRRSVTSDMRRHRITLTYLLTGWLSSRVVSVLDSGAWVQIAVSTLSGNSLRQTVHIHRASVHQAAKLVVQPS